jgi:biopolymer transport protein TolQ
MEPGGVAHAAMGLAPVDFSYLALFMRADIIVKAVMIGLLSASVWSWAIIIDKLGRIGSARQRSDKFEELFWSGRSLDDLYAGMQRKAEGPSAAIFAAAMREWKRSWGEGAAAANVHPASLRERIDKVMTVTLNRELAVLERRLGFLATVGSIAPFVGLFGTVWGIMNSFRAIATSHDTNLAVVAPGIAEALFATAMGLLAAIPAVIFFNRFTNDIGRLSVKLEGFADEFSAILSRQLDERVH